MSLSCGTPAKLSGKAAMETICSPPTAVTSISRSMPGTARPLITRNVLARDRTVAVRSRLHFATSDW